MIETVSVLERNYETALLYPKEGIDGKLRREDE